VLPLYNEEETVPQLRARLEALAERLHLTVEFVLVNDGSGDHTVELLSQWAQEDRRARVLHLARNFGHQAAATAGFDAARGDAVVLMDADLQDPPEVVVEMLARYREGYDVVYGRRRCRSGETAFKRGTAWLFYRLMRRFVHPDLPADTGDFRLLSRRCLDALRQMREVHRFLRGMVTWMGFRQTAVEFDRPPRAAGTTKYPFRKMCRFAWNAVVSFSALPLRLSLWLGLATGLAGLGYGVYSVLRFALWHDTVPGWTSQIVLTCLTSGATLFSVGLLGEYVGRIFEEVKGRPLYIVAEELNAAPSHQHESHVLPGPHFTEPNYERSVADSAREGNGIPSRLGTSDGARGDQCPRRD